MNILCIAEVKPILSIQILAYLKGLVFKNLYAKRRKNTPSIIVTFPLDYFLGIDIKTSIYKELHFLPQRFSLSSSFRVKKKNQNLAIIED
ncbi:MAG: hypothetical protein ACLFWZ_16170 [Coleofasciculus sp.]